MSTDVWKGPKSPKETSLRLTVQIYSGCENRFIYFKNQFFHNLLFHINSKPHINNKINLLIARTFFENFAINILPLNASFKTVSKKDKTVSKVICQKWIFMKKTMIFILMFLVV